ncbi:hypothetical protein GCM10027299_45890 [Larkinella ripae]
MKTFLPTRPGLRNLLFFLFFGTGFVAHAQSDYYAKTDSSKAYWKIQTDFSSQNTLIRFFNNRHEPIYQETLPGRYVKLTNRNIRLFDEMLQRLLTNQLVSAEVKSHELMAASTGVPYHVISVPSSKPVSTSYFLAPVTEPLNISPMRSDVAISDAGKLKVHAVNLLEEPMLVTLLDDQGRYIFKEKVALSHYSRTLNVTQLPEGRFRFEVSGAQKDYSYRLLIQDNPRTYQLKTIR